MRYLLYALSCAWIGTVLFAWMASGISPIDATLQLLALE